MTGNSFSDAAIPRIFTPSLAGTFSKPRHELFLVSRTKAKVLQTLPSRPCALFVKIY
jgi:hypothetical protein